MKNKKINTNELDPKVTLVLNFDYSQIKIAVSQEKDITFDKYPQSAVKLLQVNIYSTESQDMAVLHKLHSSTRERY